MKSAEHLQAHPLQSPAQAASGFKWTAMALVFVACLYASDVFAHESCGGAVLPPAQDAALSAP